MRILGIVLARLDSTRLPRKALARVGERSLIDLVVERAQQTRGLDVILATTDRAVDDGLAAHGEAQGWSVFRGNPHDVADRLVRAADDFGAEYAARINGDSPFVDYTLLERAIEVARSKSPDLVTSVPGRTFPYGVSAELLRVASLRSAIPTLTTPEREHVTRRFYERPDDYRIEMLTSDRPDLAAVRMTVDTTDDLDRLRVVQRELGVSIVDTSWTNAAEMYRAAAEGHA